MTARARYAGGLPLTPCPRARPTAAGAKLLSGAATDCPPPLPPPAPDVWAYLDAVSALSLRSAIPTSMKGPAARAASGGGSSGTGRGGAGGAGADTQPSRHAYETVLPHEDAHSLSALRGQLALWKAQQARCWPPGEVEGQEEHEGAGAAPSAPWTPPPTLQPGLLPAVRPRFRGIDGGYAGTCGFQVCVPAIRRGGARRSPGGGQATA